MKIRLIGFVVSCSVAVACSGSSGGGGGGSGDAGGGVSAQQACSDLATARCTRLQTCSDLRLDTEFQSLTDCEQRYNNNCVSSLAAPSTGNSPTLTESCAKAFPSWDCQDYLNDANIPMPCAQTKGSIATGQACTYPGQCQSGFCSILPSAACGVCAAAPAAGESCANISTCGPGLTCTSDTQTCVALAASSAKCGKGAPCAAGLVCIGADDAKGVMGTCQTGATTMGAACDPTGQTGTGCARDSGLTCNSSSKTCMPITVAASGQPCGTVENQTAACAASGSCVGASGTKSGMCVAAANDGAACAPPDPSCEALSRCIGKAAVGDAGVMGTCMPPSASSCPSDGG